MNDDDETRVSIIHCAAAAAAAAVVVVVVVVVVVGLVVVVVVVVVSQAMRSACRQMGSRTFLNQLAVDTIQHRTHGFTDEIDVSTLRDYMKVQSAVIPARLQVLFVDGGVVVGVVSDERGGYMDRKGKLPTSV